MHYKLDLLIINFYGLNWCLVLHNTQELRLIFPNSQRLNRGNYVMSQLIQACRANEVTDLILVHEHRGEPGMPWKVFPFYCKMFQILLMQDLSK